MVFPDIGDAVKFSPEEGPDLECRVSQLCINPPDQDGPIFIGWEPDGEMVWGRIDRILTINGKDVNNS